MDKNFDLLLGNPVYIGGRSAGETDLPFIAYNTTQPCSRAFFIEKGKGKRNENQD
jgi:hypothetical protein